MGGTADESKARIDVEPGNAAPTAPMARDVSKGRWWRRVVECWDSRRLIALSGVVMLLLTFALLVALVKTDQGRDLLRMARDFWSAFLLFGGLSAAIAFIVTLVTTGMTGARIAVRANEPHHFLNSPVMVVGPLGGFGMALFAALYVSNDVAAGWLFVAVWLLPPAIGMLLATLVLGLFERKPLLAPILVGVLCAAALLCVAYWPAMAGALLGSPVLLAVTAALWMLLAYALAHLPRKVVRRAILPTALAWFLVRAVLVVLMHEKGPPLDYVRTSHRATPPLLPSLGTAFEAWRKKQTGDRPTLVLVSAAGGGIRASYWTSVLLSRLADDVPPIRNQIFASSGVSGGSLGLGVFYGLLSKPDPACATDGKREACVGSFHRHDFLAAPLAATVVGAPLNVVAPFFPRSLSDLRLCQLIEPRRVAFFGAATPIGCLR
jgi:hypothetical protein